MAKLIVPVGSGEKVELHGREDMERVRKLLAKSGKPASLLFITRKALKDFVDQVPGSNPLPG